MTNRQVYEALLIELNKVQAPAVLLEDFNYYSNKAISQYINKMYNLYDINQQKSDDLRVLKSTAVLTPLLSNDFGTSTLFSNIFEVELPDDYLHILNCVVEYAASRAFKCYVANDTVHFGAKRMTADMIPQVLNNYYMRPSFKNPYYYINNVNTSNTFRTRDSHIGVFENINLHTYATEWTSNTKYALTDIVKVSESLDTVQFYKCTVAHISGALFDPAQFFFIGGAEKEPGTDWQPYFYNFESIGIEKLAKERYGNNSKVRMEIRYGKDNSVFVLSKVYVDYLRTPQYLQLTQEQIDDIEDTSQSLEFPDYVCQEIVNDLIILLLENASDPRLQTNIPINQTIAVPGQQK